MSFVQVMMKNYNFPLPLRLYKGQEKQAGSLCQDFHCTEEINLPWPTQVSSLASFFQSNSGLTTYGINGNSANILYVGISEFLETPLRSIGIAQNLLK